MDLAPIVLFVYNRPEHTRQTLLALQENHLANESELIVFSDGSKKDASVNEIQQIIAVRNVIRERKWCKNIQIVESETNKGLAQSVIDGVTKIVNKHGKIIVLEDDLITSPWFLTYMNEGLEMYENNGNVYSINGFMFPIEFQEFGTVLLPFTSTWGWATWKDKWNIFDFEMNQKEFVFTNQNIKRRFNLSDYDFSAMLGFGNNSWGIRWYFSVFKRNGLGLFPTTTLVKNIGFDGSGINCGINQDNHNFKISKIPLIRKESIDLNIYSSYLEHFAHKTRRCFLRRFLYENHK